MDWFTAGFLIADGVTTAAIYALLAFALVLLFSVTRVVFIAIGEFVSFGGLTLAAIQLNRMPPTAMLLIGLGVLAFLVEAGSQIRAEGLGRRLTAPLAAAAGKYLLFPVALYGLLLWVVPMDLPIPVEVLLTGLVLVPLGPMLYRVSYRPIADASVLVLLIISVAAHFALLGLGLLMFGPAGWSTEPFSDASFELGGVPIAGQAVAVVAIALALIGALWLYFDRSLSGKALRATAVNRQGARLVGIGTAQAGQLAFTLAIGIAVLCGVLISPITTMYYDAGFLIGLKGFVAAILGGLGSYPLAFAGALLVGMIESFSSFFASAYKEVIVFTLIIPVLLWRSLADPHVEEQH